VSSARRCLRPGQSRRQRPRRRSPNETLGSLRTSRGSRLPSDDRRTGHVPMQLITGEHDLQLKYCKEAPFYTLDLHDRHRALRSHHRGHCAAMIGGMAPLCCAMSRRRSMGWPTRTMSRRILAYNIRPAADLAKGHPERQIQTTRLEARSSPLGGSVQLGSRPGQGQGFHDETRRRRVRNSPFLLHVRPAFLLDNYSRCTRIRGETRSLQSRCVEKVWNRRRGVRRKGGGVSEGLSIEITR